MSSARESSKQKEDDNNKNLIVYEQLFALKPGSTETIRQLMYMTYLKRELETKGYDYMNMIQYLYFLDGLERSCYKYEEERGFLKHTALKLFRLLQITHRCPSSSKRISANSFVFEHAFLLEKGLRACYWMGLYQIRRLLKLVFDLSDATLDAIDWTSRVDVAIKVSDPFYSWTDHFVVLARSYLSHQYVERAWKKSSIDIKETTTEYRHVLTLRPDLIATLRLQLEGVYAFVLALETLRSNVQTRSSLLKQDKIMKISLNIGRLMAHSYACLNYSVDEYNKSEHKTIANETHSNPMASLCRRIMRYAQFSYFTNDKLDYATALWCLIRIPDTMFVEERKIAEKNMQSYGNGQTRHPIDSVPSDVTALFGGEFDKGTAPPPKLDFFSETNLPSPKVFPEFVFS